MAEQVLNDPANPPNNIPPGEFKMPTVEELLKALEGMDGLSEDNKQELKDSILSRANQENPFINPAAGGTVAGGKLMPDLLMLFSLIAIIILIFAFFGYKLYKSLVERERRKEEKKRLKQQKKKK